MSVTRELFTEKFRPKDLNLLIAPPRIKDELSRGLVQNLLLYGSPGVGKSSSLFILANPKDDTTMYVNGSSEGGVETVRRDIPRFCASMSLMGGKEQLKCVIIDECLEESEEVRIGTIDNYKSIPLKDLEKNKVYECVSMNIETGELENDTCEIISDKEDEIYEVELEDGKTIKVTDNHPFMVLNENGIICQKTIKDGLNSTDQIIVF